MSDRDIRRREREARGAPNDPEAEARLAAAQARGGADPRPRALEALERVARGFEGEAERLAGLAEVGWGWLRAGDSKRGVALAVQALGGADEPLDLAIRARARAGATLVRAGDETNGWSALRSAAERLAAANTSAWRAESPGWRAAAGVIEAWAEASEGAGAPTLPRAASLCAQVASCDEPLAEVLRSRLARAVAALGLQPTLAGLGPPAQRWALEPRRILHLHHLGGLGQPMARELLAAFQQNLDEGALSWARSWGQPPVTDRDELFVGALGPCLAATSSELDVLAGWAARLEHQGAREIALVLEAEWLRLALGGGDREVGLDRVERVLNGAAEHLGPCGSYAAGAARVLEPLGRAAWLDRDERVALLSHALELAPAGGPRADRARLLERVARTTGELGDFGLLERAAEGAAELLDGDRPELSLGPLAAAAESAGRQGREAAPTLERIGELVRALHLRQTHATAACLARCAWSARLLELERATTWLADALTRVPEAADHDLQGVGRLVEAVLDHAGPASRRESLARVSEALASTPQSAFGRVLLPAIGLISEHLGNDATLGA